jgi:hypothetical protein
MDLYQGGPWITIRAVSGRSLEPIPVSVDAGHYSGYRKRDVIGRFHPHFSSEKILFLLITMDEMPKC